MQSETRLESQVTLFFSHRCAPCRSMHHFLSAFGNENNIEIEYIEVEKNKDLVKEFDIKLTPTLFVGNERVNLKGLYSFEDLRQYLLKAVFTRPLQ